MTRNGFTYTIALIWITLILVAAFFLFAGRGLLFRVSGEPSTNLVRNPSFEKWGDGVPSYWQADSGDVASSDRAGNIYSGKLALALKAKSLSGSPATVTQSLIGFIANSDYKVNFKAKGASGEATFTYFFVNLNGSQSQTVVRQTFGPNTSYADVNFTVHLPASLSKITATLGFRNFSKEVIYLDDVSIARLISAQ